MGLSYSAKEAIVTLITVIVGVALGIAAAAFGLVTIVNTGNSMIAASALSFWPVAGFLGGIVLLVFGAVILINVIVLVIDEWF